MSNANNVLGEKEISNENNNLINIDTTQDKSFCH